MVFKVFQINSIKALWRTIFLCCGDFELPWEQYIKEYARAKRTDLLLCSQAVGEKQFHKDNRAH